MNTVLRLMVPEDFRPLLSCISPSAFTVVNWKGVITSAPLLSNRAVRGLGVAELAASQAARLPSQVVFDLKNRSAHPAMAPAFGALLLEIYFGQFFSPSGLFLDLRARHFSQTADSHFAWHPNGLWVELDDKFRRGMVEIYEGYYLGNATQMRNGLLKVGLIRDDFAPDKVQAVESMLLSHIGGDPSAQTFRVKDFTASFEKLFQFLIENKISLPADFLYLGAYLASLYLHLEELGGSYDVRAAFLKARNRALPGS